MTMFSIVNMICQYFLLYTNSTISPQIHDKDKIPIRLFSK